MILGTRSPAPYICGVCGRLAHGTGYSEKDSADILWTCRKHVSLGKRVYRMKQGQLSQYENAAVTRAMEIGVPFLLESMMTLMWDSGVRSLEQVDGDKFLELQIAAKKSAGIREAFGQFMEQYSLYLDKIISGEEAPF